MLRNGAEDLREAQAAEVNDQQEHRQQKAEVANAVDDECLLARVSRRFLLEVEADQQVRAETHTLPADEEQQEALGQHQHGHEEHEEVEIREEAPVALFVRHVPDRINVDEEANARDNREHDQSQVIDSERKTHAESGNGNPRTTHHFNRIGRASSTHRRPQPRDDARWQRSEEQSHCADDGTRQLSPQRPVDEEAGQRQQRNEPDGTRGHGAHDFIRSSSSTFSVWRVR